MLRSANESMVQLTAALEDAQRDACNAAAAAARTDKDAAARQSEAASRQRALRCVGLCDLFSKCVRFHRPALPPSKIFLVCAHCRSCYLLS